MAREQYKKYGDNFWVQQEDNIFTIGLTEDALEEIERIRSVDFPPEGEAVDSDVAIGSLETQDGSVDLYAPVSGNVVELNSAVIEDPSLILDDPYDAWLVKIESDEELGDEDEDEDEEDEDLDEDLDEDEEIEEDEE